MKRSAAPKRGITLSLSSTMACLAALVVLTLAPVPAAADGAGVARFERAFGQLQSAARSGELRRTARPVVLLSQTQTHQIRGVHTGLRPTKLTGQSELLFDGKRAYLRLTTSSKGLRPETTVSTVRVPLGRMFGWYGKRLVQAQFPGLSVKQVQQGLGKLQGAAPARPLGERVNSALQQAYSAFGHTIAP